MRLHQHLVLPGIHILLDSADHLLIGIQAGIRAGIPASLPGRRIKDQLLLWICLHACHLQLLKYVFPVCVKITVITGLPDFQDFSGIKIFHFERILINLCHKMIGRDQIVCCKEIPYCISCTHLACRNVKSNGF